MATPDSKDSAAPEDALAAPPESASAEEKLTAAASSAAPAAMPYERSGEVSDPAWPPREAAPDEAAAPTADAPARDDASPSEKRDTSPSDKRDASAAAKDATERDAALPAEEMGFSNSTLHWLADGDNARLPTGPYPTITTPSFDPTAPVAGRRRAVLVVGGAAIVAFAVAGLLYLQTGGHPSEPVATAPDPARDLVTRAESALAGNRVAEALDLAHLALAADPRFADAHFMVATCERARNKTAAARDEYRKYLALAPLGTHAEEARTALAALAP